jgi:hypothetical protein
MLESISSRLLNMSHSSRNEAIRKRSVCLLASLASHGHGEGCSGRGRRRADAKAALKRRSPCGWRFIVVEVWVGLHLNPAIWEAIGGTGWLRRVAAGGCKSARESDGQPEDCPSVLASNDVVPLDEVPPPLSRGFPHSWVSLSLAPLRCWPCWRLICSCWSNSQNRTMRQSRCLARSGMAVR